MNRKNIILGLVVLVALVGGVTAFAFLSQDNNSESTTSKSESSSSSSVLSSSRSSNSSVANNNSSEISSSQQSSSLEESSGFNSTTLAQFDGKNGKDCYVAIDGTVYNITGAPGWSNGVHTASNGQGKCGEDGTRTIGQSPHGKAALSGYPKVGSYN